MSSSDPPRRSSSRPICHRLKVARVAARRISPAEQHERRRQVIRAYQRKVNKRQIAREVGLSYSATCKVIDRFKAGGLAALAPRLRGR